jgi:hypothetical protein
MGCELPGDLLGSNESNPEGHWESLRGIEINDALLTALGSRWDDIGELPSDWLQRPRPTWPGTRSVPSSSASSPARSCGYSRTRGCADSRRCGCR